MEDVHNYTITVRGLLAAADIAPFSPPGLVVLRSPEPAHSLPDCLGEGQAASEFTTLNFRSDQAAMIAFIRQLHAQGLILLSVRSVEA